jgi:hypothetical protein
MLLASWEKLVGTEELEDNLPKGDERIKDRLDSG